MNKSLSSIPRSLIAKLLLMVFALSAASALSACAPRVRTLHRIDNRHDRRDDRQDRREDRRDDRHDRWN